MKEDKFKKFGFSIGSILASVCAICLATCGMAIMIAATYRFVTWMLGGII